MATKNNKPSTVEWGGTTLKPQIRKNKWQVELSQGPSFRASIVGRSYKKPFQIVAKNRRSEGDIVIPAAEHHNNIAKSHFRRGLSAYNSGRLAEAIGEIGIAIQYNQHHKGMQDRLALMKEEAAGIRRDIEKLRIILNEHGENCQARFDLAKYLLMLGHENEAKAEFMRVAKCGEGRLSKIAANMSLRITH